MVQSQKKNPPLMQQRATGGDMEMDSMEKERTASGP